MSQFALTAAERIESLRRFGYTEREGAFLVVAALHSGFFLRRQYQQFTGKSVGGTVAELVRKAVAMGHASYVTACNKTNVYHLCSRPFYAALGQEDNRNRRTRPPVAIKNRLMCLDFFLDNPGYRYFTTEQEKLAYFRGQLGLHATDLPAKVFRGITAKQTSLHFFTEKYPVFIAHGVGRGELEAGFCFVDEGLAATDRFESFLQEYERLFIKLARFRVIYVAASTLHFERAKAVFEAHLSGPGIARTAVASEAEFAALTGYFEARQLFENRALESFDRAKLIQLRDDRERFSKPVHEALFEVWKVGGEAALRQKMAPAETVRSPIAGTFETYLLKHNYDLFAYLRPKQEVSTEAVNEAT